MISSRPAARFVVGVTVGGAFTDVFALDETTGGSRAAKIPAAQGEPAETILAAIKTLVPDLPSVKTIAIGGAVAPDAMRRGRRDKIGVITSAGVSHLLDASEAGSDSASLVPRALRLEAPERTAPDGTVEKPVDTLAVLEAAQALKAEGCAAIAIMFANAPANPRNERVAAEALRAIWPNGYVTSAVELSPEADDRERFSAAALNAALQPATAGMLTALERAVKRGGARPEMLVMQSNGGLTTFEGARRFPARMVFGGPAAEALAAARIAGSVHHENVIVCGIGDAATDVALIVDGPQERRNGDGEIRPAARIADAGLGARSLAWIEEGRVRIGPEAGAPACFGLGDDRPTLLDAELVLGRITPDRLRDGADRVIDVAAAERALLAHVGAPLGKDAFDAAEAVLSAANAAFSETIRNTAAEKSLDLRGCAGIFHGDLGPLHAGTLLRDLGLTSALVPIHPRAMSAVGCAFADLRVESARSLNIPLESVDFSALTEDLRAAAAETEAALSRTGAAIERIDHVAIFEVRQAGRSHLVTIANAAPDRDALSASLVPGEPAVLVSRRVASIGRRPAQKRATDGKSFERARIGSRAVFAQGGWREVPVYDRLALPVGTQIIGPAVIEQADAAIFIDPRVAFRVDEVGSLVLEETAEEALHAPPAEESLSVETSDASPEELVLGAALVAAGSELAFPTENRAAEGEEIPSDAEVRAPAGQTSQATDSLPAHGAAHTAAEDSVVGNEEPRSEPETPAAMIQDAFAASIEDALATDDERAPAEGDSATSEETGPETENPAFAPPAAFAAAIEDALAADDERAPAGDAAATDEGSRSETEDSAAAPPAAFAVSVEDALAADDERALAKDTDAAVEDPRSEIEDPVGAMQDALAASIEDALAADDDEPASAEHPSAEIQEPRSETEDSAAVAMQDAFVASLEDALAADIEVRAPAETSALAIEESRSETDDFAFSMEDAFASTIEEALAVEDDRRASAEDSAEPIEESRWDADVSALTTQNASGADEKDALDAEETAADDFVSREAARTPPTPVSKSHESASKERV